LGPGKGKGKGRERRDGVGETAGGARRRIERTGKEWKG